jgi:hypothetical protein
MHAMTRLLASASLLTMAVAGVSAAPQSTDSATAAATLTGLLTARNLDAIAAADPAAADRFIAALYIPGDQLLVVAGSHSTPAFLRRRLEQTQYRDLYVDLQATPTPNGKLFVMDSSADGLRASRERDRSFDIVYRDGTRQTLLNGDWEGQKLTETEYRQRFATVEREYTHMLSTLAALRQPPAEITR